MGWQCFATAFELASPLHIGFHKIGSVQRTRHYLPARNLLAAGAERFVHGGLFPSYQDALRWVQQHLAFSYLFVAEERELIPCYADEGLKYGELDKKSFERRYVSAHVTTAIEASGTAEEGSLHEVEFISAHTLDETETPRRTQVSARIFVRDDAWDVLGDEAALRSHFAQLQVGGERRYGFGRLRLCPMDWQSKRDICGWPLTLNAFRPQVELPRDAPLLAHVPTNEIQARGMIEPLVGRETRADSGKFGRHLTPGRICWVPGSVCENVTALQFAEDGTWVAARRS